MTTIKCFLLEPSDRARESLRRFVWSSEGNKCPGPWGYHNADMDLGEVPYDAARPHGDNHDHADPRWPTHCGCGYAFKPDDQWQYNQHQLYRRVDGGQLYTLGGAPVGAMWRAPWYGPGKDGKGPLILKTPGGDWDIDGPASNGPGWTRTGEPPLITATPSIGMHNRDGSWRYHGWLRNGELVDA
jgi:hypothetical protein